MGVPAEAAEPAGHGRAGRSGRGGLKRQKKPPEWFDVEEAVHVASDALILYLEEREWKMRELEMKIQRLQSVLDEERKK